jgi:hypothetical protein
MTDGPADGLIPGNDPTAVELLLAVRGGDVGAIRRLIGEHPDLPRWRIGDRKGRTGSGAKIDATPDYSDSLPVQVAGQPDTMRQALVSWLQERAAGQE